MGGERVGRIKLSRARCQDSCSGGSLGDGHLEVCFVTGKV